MKTCRFWKLELDKFPRGIFKVTIIYVVVDRKFRAMHLHAVRGFCSDTALAGARLPHWIMGY
jgi:hypothetical protein